MALPATAQIEVRTTGSDSNGGGFDPVIGAGKTDYSQQNSAQAAGTVTSSTTTVTATTGIFTSAMVGNYITNGTTWKIITAFTSSTVVTVDSAPSWTAASIKVGGALLTIAKGLAIAVNGNIVWVAAGTYSITVAMSTAISVEINGYNGSRSSDFLPFNLRPVLQAGIDTIALITVSGAKAVVRNFTTDGNAHPSVAGIQASGANQLIANIHGVAMTNTGIAHIGSNSTIVRCYMAVSGSAIGYTINGTNLTCLDCFADLAAGGSGNGFNSGTTPTMFVNCIARGGGGGTAIGFSDAATGTVWLNCVAYNTGFAGFSSLFQNGTIGINCIAYGCGTYGFYGGTANTTHNGFLLNCAGGNNPLGNVSNFASFNFKSLSSSPFVSTSNLALNTTAGGGQDCRAAGFPGALEDGTTTAYTDIGAVQHPDPTQPAADHVYLGTVYNDGQTTGTLVLPDDFNVLKGISYGLDFVGTLVVDTGSQTALFMM